MSEIITVPGRTINTITAEIVALSNQAAQNAWFSMVEIGKRLVEAKAMVDHGEWGSYLKNEVNFSQRTANNFMNIYQEHLKNPNSQALANLSYTKVVRLLAIPEDDREELLQEHNVSAMSSRDLDKVIKERNELQAANEAADAKIRELEQNLMDAEARASSAKSSESAWQAEIDKLNANLAKAREDVTKAKNQAQSLRDNPIIPKSMKDKLVSDAKAQASKEAEKALQAQISAAKDQAQKAADAQAAAEKEAQEARAQLAAVRKAELFADRDSAALNAISEQIYMSFNSASGYLKKITASDPEKGATLKSALIKLIDQMRNALVT